MQRMLAPPAMALIAAGVARPAMSIEPDIDLGRINDDSFANRAAIGLPALVGRSVPRGVKRWFGITGRILVGHNRSAPC